MSDLTISAALNEARLEATRAHIDSGSGVGRIRLYDGTRPAGGGTPTLLLAEIALSEPCGTVSGGVLTLASTDLPLVMNSGVATWARIVNGNGDYCIDSDVSSAAGSAPIKVNDTTLIAGGKVTLVSGILG